jgi:hypothetical protein
VFEDHNRPNAVVNLPFSLISTFLYLHFVIESVSTSSDSIGCGSILAECPDCDELYINEYYRLSGSEKSMLPWGPNAPV